MIIIFWVNSSVLVYLAFGLSRSRFIIHVGNRMTTWFSPSKLPPMSYFVWISALYNSKNFGYEIFLFFLSSRDQLNTRFIMAAKRPSDAELTQKVRAKKKDKYILYNAVLNI